MSHEQPKYWREAYLPLAQQVTNLIDENELNE